MRGQSTQEATAQLLLPWFPVTTDVSCGCHCGPLSLVTLGRALSAAAVPEGRAGWVAECPQEQDISPLTPKGQGQDVAVRGWQGVTAGVTPEAPPSLGLSWHLQWGPAALKGAGTEPAGTHSTGDKALCFPALPLCPVRTPQGHNCISVLQKPPVWLLLPVQHSLFSFESEIQQLCLPDKLKFSLSFYS